MAWAKIERDKVVEYPYTPAKLRAEYPSVSFSDVLADEALADYGVVEVAEVSPPTVTTGQVAVLGAPALVAGAWRQTWTVRTKGADELAAARFAKWAAAKFNRDAAIDAGCTVDGIGRFDSDPASRNNITGAVVGAMIAKAAAAPFSMGWKLQDNSLVVLDGLQMIDVGMAVMKHTADCHAHAQALGLAIQGAASFAALDAIDIAAGWPK